MALNAGTRVGAYEILEAIGAGGMGQVFRARDTKLNRDVALKVLPPLFTDDPERLARFRREAQVLASLNHPNIATIHGFEDSGETHALVLELVEGPTLADRIGEGAIPFDEALPIARQIAEALEAAHEQGIIHRDLKPANIKITPDGAVKVLDFGLAKALDPAAGGSGVNPPGSGPSGSALTLANSPTFTAAATQAGFILGTAAYMSPEQAKGRPVDRRTDIWAYGVVLFEMLTGRQTFGASDVSDTLAAVLRKEVDLDELPDDTPALVRRLLRRCLERDRKQRLPDIGMARLELAEVAAGTDSAPTVAPAPAPSVAFWQRPAGIAAIAAVTLAVGALLAWSLKQPPTVPKPLAKFGITLPEGVEFSSTGRHVVAIAPDGSFFVHTGDSGIWIRRRSELESTRIPGVEGAREIFVSHDSQWIGFQSDGQFRKVAVSGGAPVPLAETGGPYGVSWSTDGSILIGLGSNGIVRVPETGGAPQTVVDVSDAGGSASNPQMLPGGEWVLFTYRPPTVSAWDESEIVVQSLATGAREVITRGADARYLSSGHLVYLVGGVLFGVTFDVDRRAVVGGPVSLVEGVLMSSVSGAGQFSLADDGTLVYRSGVSGREGNRTIVAVDQAGVTTQYPVAPGVYLGASVSPDGRKVAFGNEDDQDVWVADLERGSLAPVTRDPAFDGYPIWTPEGDALVFTSARDGLPALYRQAADGTGAAERIFSLDGSTGMAARAWTPDGTRLVVVANLGEGQSERGDIGLATPGSPGVWEPLIDSEAREALPAISPDGRWIAYSSEDSGRFEVYVQRFPELGRRVPISIGGGYGPEWSADGRELYFLRAPNGPPRAMMRVAITETGETITAGQPEPLFDWTFFDHAGSLHSRYDILPDGRFLMVAREDQTAVQDSPFDLIVIQNWVEELKARVPVK